MRTAFFILFFILFCNYSSFCQKKIKNELSISAPVVWNHTEQKQGARDREGNAWSYGFNASYAKTVYKNWFVVGGAGYYKQRFGVSKIFNYNDWLIRLRYPATRIGYFTKDYSYDCWHFLVGMGYNHYLNSRNVLKGSLSYNQLFTFHQTYRPAAPQRSSSYTSMTSDTSYPFGHSLNLSIGSRHFLGKHFLYGMDVLLPVYTSWKKDVVFLENPEEQYRPKLTAGVNMSISYHF